MPPPFDESVPSHTHAAGPAAVASPAEAALPPPKSVKPGHASSTSPSSMQPTAAVVAATQIALAVASDERDSPAPSGEAQTVAGRVWSLAAQLSRLVLRRADGLPTVKQDAASEGAPQAAPERSVDMSVSQLRSKSAAASAPDQLPWWMPRRSVCMRLLQHGPIPRHVAFIMDGNRRFAKKIHVNTAMGHALGFDKLEQTLDWCLELGVRIVTVYAFSIENFKRSSQEVTALMDLAKVKFARLIEESEVIQKHGVSIRVLGDVTMLPLDVQQAIARAVTLSRNNSKSILNICFPYTSRHEMVEATKQIATGLSEGRLQESDITEDLFERCMYTADAPDLFVRTSGEVRLSDFMLWQSAFSHMYFAEVLWPEFSLWDLFVAVLHYQRNHNHVQTSRKQYLNLRNHWQMQHDLASGLGNLLDSPQGAQSASECLSARKQRQTVFLKWLEQSRMDYFETLCRNAKPSQLSA
ncbi:dehydrodolichyl diphosphate synthase [Capsaspora owczarzaki ATCC 30864]|uniref:Ditrans,polycis-polyprenyl diphosphate synthase ((2E,6E)-farnesyl diphosphate specific) n=1 Tax=Capsaspora owczarzaki (strain ATCC 30864) TaxID=595528 RepID=A0A0D2WR81_CAPO3|nr:dehydrodolichyl diphosphate synthase [Capsaspora owczarzaki ATCC 30864]KJE93643.1 dehydrodolichyl diphosphate synthase [Capsaspora owczarzaki ATCC 30864]|eukprot:XP_004348226.2 dehydrodolichyl diphosphate synthase [Capsaspora owczarzaki ATCC 30864]